MLHHSSTLVGLSHFQDPVFSVTEATDSVYVLGSATDKAVLQGFGARIGLQDNDAFLFMLPQSYAVCEVD